MTDSRLNRLLQYWNDKRADRAMPARADIDPLELREHLGRLHLLDVLGLEQFRFRLYGSAVTNPDVVDMTGRTTLDYADKTFGALVTRHYQVCVEERGPVYYVVRGVLDNKPYEYGRLTLPISSDGVRVDMLLVSPHRIRISANLPATEWLSRL